MTDCAWSTIEPVAAPRLLVGHSRVTRRSATQAPKTHRLEATPETVAYGHYWSETKPVLRIASGDIIDVDTLLTSTPSTLARAGVRRRQDPGVAQGRGRRVPARQSGRGPGGHILTGPVYVEGAMPGDALEVKVLSIDLPIDYGYNGCCGLRAHELRPGAGTRILQLDRKTMTSEFAAGDRDSAEAVLRQHGRGAGAGDRAASAAIRRDATRAISTTASSSPDPRCTFRSSSQARCSKSATATRRRATAKSIRPRSKRRCAARLQLTVRKDMTLKWPRAETATDYITMATDPDLTVATKAAIQEMVDFLGETKGLTKHQAYQLTSIAGNVAMTQLVDLPNLGVHVKMPKDIFKK